MWIGCWLLGGASTAHAGSGPWVIGPGQGSVYVGVESGRLTKLATTVDGERSVVNVGQGLSSFGVKAIGTIGITSRFELEGQLPWYLNSANRPDEPLCAALGAEACATTQTIGVIDVRAKGLALDEYFGAPVSLALGVEFRYGAFTSETRARLTNAGEGTTDLGPFVSVGRIGSLGGSSVLAGHLTSGWRYRFPTTRDFPDPEQGTRSAPLPEIWLDTELRAGPSPSFSLGPQASLLHRDGLDYGDVDATDPDWLAALGITNVRVGGVAVLDDGKSLSLSLSVLGTAFARNNPTDTLSVNVGVAWRGGRSP